tara:strand:+ start:946 stop:1374 length:429 start_codon:yes stop_codon:yes gene_type:complete
MNRILLIGFCALVAAAIGGGLWVVGSPTHARMQKQDADRLEDLAGWRSRLRCVGDDEVLPQSLAEVPDCPGSTAFASRALPTQDAVTGAPYVYHRLSDQAFEVCVTLALDPEEARKAGFLRTDMELRAGNVVCLTGTIAPKN